MRSSGSSYASSSSDRDCDSSSSEADIVYCHELSGCEPLDSYEPGGLHPVKLNTVLQSANANYRIVAKLGWGGFATVWLVERLHSTSWVALKICRADSSPSHEVGMLRTLNVGPAAPYVPALLDEFTIDGSNGTHAVIVTDVVAPIPEEFTGLWAYNPSALKAISRSIVDAVAHLHASGVAHGDLHLYNMGFAKPWLNLNDNPAYAEYAADAHLFPVFSRALDDEVDPEIPRYIVAEMDFFECHKRAVTVDTESPSRVKLLDFGSGTRAIGRSVQSIS